jgi:undecaprenyl-diphosphatase
VSSISVPSRPKLDCCAERPRKNRERRSMLTSQAIILGVIQGVTEFMPVSSTAHLTLAGKLMGLVRLDDAEGRTNDWTAFMAVIQIGTLLAALIYFFPDLIHIADGLGRTILAVFTKHDVGADQTQWAWFGWLLIAGSLPIGIAGLIFRKRVEGKLTKSLRLILLSMMAVTVLMAIAEAGGSKSRVVADLGFPESITVGIFQILALLPGASRSGATIAAGLMVGLNRQAAARFSFLLMIPAVGASGLLKLPVALRSMNAGRIQILAAVFGAGVSGYLAIGFMLGYLETHTLFPFVVYRCALGILVWCFLLSGRQSTS